MAQLSANFSPEEVVAFLKENLPGISVDVFTTIVTQKIDGEILLELSDSDMREIAPLLGDRLKIKRIIQRSQAPVSHCFLVAS